MVHVPQWLLEPMVYFPTSGLAFLRRHVELSNCIARKLIQSRLPEDDADKKDALSRIGANICGQFGHALSDVTYSVMSNRTEAGRWQLTDEELAPQLWWVLAGDNRHHVG
jgi:hypothetical protein